MRNLFCIILLLSTNFLLGQESQTMDSLTTILEKIFYEDQVPRQQLDSIEKKFGFSSIEVHKHWDRIIYIDSINTKVVSQIIDKYGWLSASQTSNLANRTLFLIIQHSNSSTQEKYLDTLKEAAKTGHARPADYALLLDRTNGHKGKFQEFGSQLSSSNSGKLSFDPIRDEPNVNKRRQSIGLSSMEEYAKFFNLSYTQPKRDLYRNRFVVRGYITDESSKPLENVVIEVNEKYAAKTDADGYYLIVLKKKFSQSNIRYSKNGFLDIKITLAEEVPKEVYVKFVRMKACL